MGAKTTSQSSGSVVAAVLQRARGDGRATEISIFRMTSCASRSRLAGSRRCSKHLAECACGARKPSYRSRENSHRPPIQPYVYVYTYHKSLNQCLPVALKASWQPSLQSSTPSQLEHPSPHDPHISIETLPRVKEHCLSALWQAAAHSSRLIVEDGCPSRQPCAQEGVEQPEMVPVQQWPVAPQCPSHVSG